MPKYTVDGVVTMDLTMEVEADNPTDAVVKAKIEARKTKQTVKAMFELGAGRIRLGNRAVEVPECEPTSDSPSPSSERQR